MRGAFSTFSAVLFEGNPPFRSRAPRPRAGRPYGFSFSRAPSLEETQRLVLRVDGAPKPPPSRVTFTLPLLNAARHVALLVTGKDKAQALARVLADDEALPAARLDPDGTLTILADSAALSLSTNLPRPKAPAPADR